MVDWDRVEELRSKGWDWDRIAEDPKVGFHPETSVREPGRALRGLYHQQRLRQRRQGGEKKTPRQSKEAKETAERKWNLARVGYLLLPIFAIWFVLAYVLPSPVGLVLPAIPYLALGLVVAAFILLFGLLRSSGARWSKVYRTTLVYGVVIGLVFSGMIALGGYLFFGCPVLPSSGSAQAEGWMTVSASPWQDSGKPVVYFFGATWCPYCSASSWAIWKALTEYGPLTGAYTGYSYGSPEPYEYTPEMVLANAVSSSSYLSFQVSEYVYGSDSVFPTTSNCVQQAYVTAYSGGSIPFLVINGQYVHGGSTIIDPATLTTWANGQNGGAGAVQSSVSSENGTAWSIIQTQAWWIMTYIAKGGGATPANLAQQPYYSGWSSATKSAVAGDLAQLG